MDHWLKVAKTLKIGQSIRVKCCSSDKSMIVSASEWGWTGYCFRCSADPKEARGEVNLKEQSRIKYERELFDRMQSTRKVALPTDFTEDIDKDGLLWLLKAGINKRLREIYQIGYSPNSGRVVLPIYKDLSKRNLVAIQMRATQPNIKPKYLNLSGLPIRAVTHHSLSSMMCQRGKGVVVEDILSCIRVGEVTPATSILGTTMTSERVVTLAKKYSHVYLWMDPDAAGAKGMVDARKQLAFQGVTSSVVRTEKDPKFYSKREIADILTKQS